MQEKAYIAQIQSITNCDYYKVALNISGLFPGALQRGGQY